MDDGLDVCGRWPAGAPMAASDSGPMAPAWGARLHGPRADGVIMAWQDLRSGSHFDIYAQRLGPSGNPLWTPGGVRLRNSNLGQWLNVPKQPAITGDGAGGAIVAWEQYVTGYNTDIRAQR